MVPLGEHSDSAELDWELAAHLRRRFGRYELVGKLGSGGMANVYLARAAGPGGFTKLVAVKCIHPHLAEDPQFIDMFLDEARIAACIDHPNVCSAFDFGEIDGVYFLAMDYLVGEPWSEVLQKLHAWEHGRSAADRHAFVARIVADAAEGLHAAHEAIGPDGEPLEVVHRDVAPPNLFLRYDGQVQVVDFGCAKAAKRMFRTEYGKVRGHIAYVAPELLRGHEADRRADVWSLGVVAWELLTGVRLFRRTSLHDTMFAVARDEVPMPSMIAPSVPEELEAIVMRALAREPDERYATARQFAEALTAYVRSTGAGLGLRELAGWMEALFPGGRKRAADAIERVQKHEESSGARPRPPRRRPDYPTTRDKLPVLADAQPSEPPPTRMVRVPRIAELPARLRGFFQMRPRTLLTAAAVVLALCAGTLLDEIGVRSHATTQADAVPVIAETAEPAPAPAREEVSAPIEVEEPEEPAPSIDGADGVGLRESDEPTPSERRPSARAGRVNVLTPGGWANVALGDRTLGPTPGQFTLPAGRHRLRLISGDGGEERVVWVTVRPGRTARIVEPL